MMNRYNLDFEYKQDLDKDIIQYLAECKNLSILRATEIYYRSKLSKQIARNENGIENMDYKYLVEDLIENESELFTM